MDWRVIVVVGSIGDRGERGELCFRRGDSVVGYAGEAAQVAMLGCDVQCCGWLKPCGEKPRERG
jgi:hypothetical protein